MAIEMLDLPINSMVMFNRYVKLPEGMLIFWWVIYIYNLLQRQITPFHSIVGYSNTPKFSAVSEFSSSKSHFVIYIYICIYIYTSGQS